MIEFFQNFHFLRPWVFLLFFIPIAFYFRKIKFGGNISSWENVCDENLLKFLRYCFKLNTILSNTDFCYTGDTKWTN